MKQRGATSTGSTRAGKQETISARLPAELVDALDRFIAGEQPAMSRSQALRAAFRDWATERGYLESTDDGLKPDELNASNDD